MVWHKIRVGRVTYLHLLILPNGEHEVQVAKEMMTHDWMTSIKVMRQTGETAK